MSGYGDRRNGGKRANQGPMFEGNLPEAVSHADGICLNSTVSVDDALLLEDGKVVHPELVDIAKAMGK